MALNRTLAWLLVLLLVPAACARPSAGAASPPPPPAPGPVAGAVRAVVAFWVDGDSVHVRPAIAVTTCLDLAVGVIDPRAGRERV